MSFNNNQIKEGYGTADLEWSDYPNHHDPHRCGNSPFSPNITADGCQNSCGSYCSGFDKNGCNKYLPNYPDDYYILNYVASGGNCDDLKDCKREITPIPHPGRDCGKQTNVVGPMCTPDSPAALNGLSGLNGVKGVSDYASVEHFGLAPKGPLGVLLWIFFLYLIAKIIFGKK